jgi:hypothetical protein
VARVIDPVKCLCGKMIGLIPDSATYEYADEYQEAGWSFECNCGAPLYIPAEYVRAPAREEQPHGL